MSKPVAKPRNPIQMGVIGAPHGVRGELRVKSFTGDPLALGDYGPLFTEDGRQLDIVDLRPAKTVVVARFRQVTTREAAEALNGTALFVDRSALPDDLDDEEFYHADLIGLAVVDREGGSLGKVLAFHNFGGGDIVEIALAGKKTVLVPFSAAAVPQIDVAGGRIVVDPAAAGLLPDADEPPAADQRPRGPREAGGNR